MTPDYDIEIDQGTDTERIFNCVDGYGNAMDFSGYTARMQIRRSTYKTTPLDELTTENGRLFFDGARLTAIFPSDVTSRYPPGRRGTTSKSSQVRGVCSGFSEGTSTSFRR